MPTCALINLAQGIVENVIVAEAGDPVPDGYRLVADPPVFVGPGIKWDGAGFVEPHYELRSPPKIAGLKML